MATRQTIGADTVFARGVAAAAPSFARSRSLAATTAFAGVCLVAVAAPFELSRPALTLPWQTVSSVELVVGLAIGAWVSAAMWTRSVPILATPLTVPWLVFLAVMCVAAVMAPADRINALHMTGRLTVALVVALLVVNGITSASRLMLMMTGVVISGVVVGVTAILESFRVSVVLEWLRAFRPSVFAVGSLVRAGGTLQYPTIASMYLEIVFAFGLGLMLTALDRRRPAGAIVMLASVAIVADAIIWTFTRTGLAAMAIAFGIVGATRLAARGPDRGMRWLARLAVLILALFVTSRSAQAMWLRLTSEGQETWYRASIEAPRTLALNVGSPSTARVRVTNLGRLTWDSTDDPPILLSYHWLQADGERVVSFNGVRTSFAAPVAAGQTATLDAVVRPPAQPGRYQLEWDLVQEHRLWFNTEPGAVAATYSTATVSGTPTGVPMVTTPRPRRAVRPGRLQLWRAAARMFAAHPWLGVGPDNFRLAYGPYAGLANPDQRTHANNMYIEMFVGGGMAAGLAFLWLMWRVAGHSVAAMRGARNPDVNCRVAITAACAAVLVHGLVDSFWSFTPTYVLIALTFGLAVVSTRDAEAQGAHRF